MWRDRVATLSRPAPVWRTGRRFCPSTPLCSCWLESLAGGGFASVGTAAGVLPDLGAGAEPARLFQAVTRVLAQAAATRPVVAIFEDLHWADESTRDLLNGLLPRVSTEPVLFVGTYRTDELHDQHELLPLLASIERSVLAERINLRPMSRAEIGALAAEILGAAPDDADVDTLYARSAGALSSPRSC